MALLKLSLSPSEFVEEVLRAVESFAIFLHDSLNPYIAIGKARRKLFVRKSNIQLIFPTMAALEEHLMRAVYQRGHVFGKVLLPAPGLLAATS